MLYIITLTYNEKDYILEHIEKLKKINIDHKIIISDSSNDGTFEILKKQKDIYVIHGDKGIPIQLIRAINLVKSLRNKKTIDNKYDMITIIDVGLDPLILNTININNNFIFCGFRKSYHSLLRRIISKIGKILMNIFWGKNNIKDYTFGYRVYPYRFFLDAWVPIDCPSYLCNAFLAYQNKHYKIKNFEVKDMSGKSHLKVKDLIISFVWIIRNRKYVNKKK